MTSPLFGLPISQSQTQRRLDIEHLNVVHHGTTCEEVQYAPSLLQQCSCEWHKVVVDDALSPSDTTILHHNDNARSMSSRSSRPHLKRLIWPDYFLGMEPVERERGSD